MRNEGNIDSMIKSAIDYSISDIKPSRDIFNEAWNNREIEMIKKSYFNVKNIKTAILVSVCCVTLAIGGGVTFSSGARAVVQEALKTIFLIDKSGNIEEKSEATEVVFSINGKETITNENKADVEKRLGFKLNLPKNIGEYRLGTYLYGPQVNIVARGIKYKDEDKIREKMEKAISDDKVFKELEEDYKMSREVFSTYINDQQQELYVWLSKDSGENLKDYKGIIKEEKINDIECIVVEGHYGNYDTTVNTAGNLVPDMEHKPASVEKSYNICWKYDGVMYQIIGEKKSPDINSAMEFVKDYIKILKQR